MMLTPLEWGLRAPITPRLGGNRWALPRLGKSELNEEKQTTQNTKLRILPGVLAAIEHRAGLRPLGMHIGRCHAPAKLSGHTFSAVRHGVCLDKARSAHIPMLGAN